MPDNLSSERHQVNSLLNSDLGTALPLHISLSRPLMLVTDERQPFNDSLASEINRSSLRPYVTMESRKQILIWPRSYRFELSLRGLAWVSNNEKTRWFLVMHVLKPPMNELNRILQVSNGVAQKFRNLPLYAEPQSPFGPGPSRKLTKNTHGRHHRALPYTSSPYHGSQSEMTPDASSHFHVSIAWSLARPPEESVTWLSSRTDKDLNFCFTVSSVKVKIGNAVTALALSSKLEISNGIVDT